MSIPLSDPLKASSSITEKQDPEKSGGQDTSLLNPIYDKTGYGSCIDSPVRVHVQDVEAIQDSD